MSQTDLMRNLSAANDNKVLNQQKLILSSNEQYSSCTEEFENDMSYNRTNEFVRRQPLMAFSDPACSDNNAIPTTTVVMFPRT